MHPLRFAFFTAAVSLACAGCHASSGPAAASASPAPAAATIKWVNYTDSAEGAFSMDVPLGWQVTGGMYRFGYFDVRWAMIVRSLDGNVIIRIDDPGVPPYELPSVHSGAVGHLDNKPNQYQMVVENYEDASIYAPAYAKKLFTGVCTSLTPNTSAWTPNLPGPWQAVAGAKVTQASLGYDCATSAGARVVNVFARDSLPPGQGFWTVDPIISILATPAELQLAQSMTQHMIDSWQINPAWQQHQQQITQMGLNQIVQNFGQFMQQMQAFDQQRQAAMNQQVAGFEAQQNAQAQQVSNFGEILTGLTTVADSQTGAQFQIFSGPKANYWTDGSGNTINSNLSPGAGFHQLTVTGP
jgi:hypothetical protein